MPKVLNLFFLIPKVLKLLGLLESGSIGKWSLSCLPTLVCLLGDFALFTRHQMEAVFRSPRPMDLKSEDDG